MILYRISIKYAIIGKSAQEKKCQSGCGKKFYNANQGANQSRRSDMIMSPLRVSGILCKYFWQWVKPVDLKFPSPGGRGIQPI